MICALCGREVKELIEGLCVDCFRSRRSIFEIPRILNVTRCPRCGLYLFSGKWEDIDEESAFLRCVTENISVFSEIESEEVEVELYERTENSAKLAVRLRGKLAGEEVEEEKFTEIRTSKVLCDMCSRIAGGYYEGVIQIRAEGREVKEEELQEIIDSIFTLVERASEKGDRKAFVTRVERRRDGTNVYLGSKKLGKQICKKLAEEYGGKFLEAPELVGREDGVEKYRVTYSFRLPKFRKGDVAKLNKRVVAVFSQKKGYRCIDLESGEEIFCSEKMMNNEAKFISSASSAPRTVVTYVRDDVMEVLHPSSYVPVTIQRPSFVDEKTKEIRVVVIGDRIYPIPEWL